ncbi:MAG: aminopeptidase P family protein [Pyrinomonadaceae bacterium]|nr:aminopeptidase P family protein [Pyrinomonadaceae bacterium]
MKVHKTISRNVACAALLAMLFSTSLLMVGARAGDTNKTSGVIRPAPSAPVFSSKERLAELAQRRARVAQAIGSKAVLILFSAEPRVYANDVDYEYRQENNLYYLTQLKQKRATLVLIPGNQQTPEILFIPRRDPLAEVWNGHMYSVEEAAQASGIREIWEAREFEPFVQALRNRQAYQPKSENILMSMYGGVPQAGTSSGFESAFAAAEKNEAELYMLAPRGSGPSREYVREQGFATEWTKAPGGFVIKNAGPIFADMRLRKSPMELRLLQHAIDITSEAQQRAWLAAGDAKWEYEVDAEVIYTFKRRNADHWGYPSIVGCGPNATTLHYIESQGAVNPGELILMDVGAEYEHYTADVTRTFPVSGKFSPAQAEIYQVVYDAQDAAAGVIRPGAMYSDVHRAALGVIKEGLLKLGLITDKNSEQYRIWFMHGTSHWLGMNVHDVGNAAKLEPGMVFTNEPGIYVRPDALDHQPFGWKQDDWEKFKATVRPAFEKYKGIGVRIEDDMLVTVDGTRWMTEALPRKMSEIEAVIANGRGATR